MERKQLNKAGLAALVVLAPGGMILGGLLAWRAYRKRVEAAAAENTPAPQPPRRKRTKRTGASPHRP